MEISVKISRIFPVLAALVLTAMTGQASLVTNDGGFGAVTINNFNQFNCCGYGFTFGPVNVGNGVTFFATGPDNSGMGAVLGNGNGSDYGLTPNGSWRFGAEPGGAYTGIDGATATETFVFSTDVSAVGGFMNYAPGSGPDAMIIALGDSANILEAYDLVTSAPISTPGGVDQGAFRGILRTTADIHAFAVLNDYAVLDDLTFSAQTSVPEPNYLALVGLGLAGAFAIRRRTSS